MSDVDTATGPANGPSVVYVVMEVVGGEWEVCSVWSNYGHAVRAAHRKYFAIERLCPVVLLRAPLNDDTVEMEGWPEVLHLVEDGPQEAS